MPLAFIHELPHTVKIATPLTLSTSPRKRKGCVAFVPNPSRAALMRPTLLALPSPPGPPLHILPSSALLQLASPSIYTPWTWLGEVGRLWVGTDAACGHATREGGHERAVGRWWVAGSGRAAGQRTGGTESKDSRTVGM